MWRSRTDFKVDSFDFHLFQEQKRGGRSHTPPFSVLGGSMDWGIEFSGELQKMKEDMDRKWSFLFEKDRGEGNMQCQLRRWAP